MQIFDLLKLVLDEEYARISGPDKDAAINAAIETLASHYKTLSSPCGAGPDYSKSEARFGYIMKYTTCHADIVEDKICNVNELDDLFRTTPGTKEWVKVACIGGGPGSDFLGIMKRMVAKGSTTNLQCFLLDKEPAWGDTWAGIDQHATEQTFRVSTHSQEFDVTVPSSWKKQTKYLHADLFTFIFFISEIWRFKSSAEPFFAHLFSEAGSGSQFLFVDNKAPTFYGWFDEMAGKAGLGRVRGGEGWFQIGGDEQKSALEPYATKFAHGPKLGSDIAWRVYRKP